MKQHACDCLCQHLEERSRKAAENFQCIAERNIVIKLNEVILLPSYYQALNEKEQQIRILQQQLVSATLICRLALICETKQSEPKYRKNPKHS